MLRLSGLSALLGLSASSMIPCTYSFEEPKATFDLSALYIEKGNDARPMYSTNDTFMMSRDLARPFTYFFNVCGDVDEPDEVNMCHKNFTGTLSAAYQHVNGTAINGGKEECWALGRAESPVWEYISGDNAAVGVSLTYQQGSDCYDAPGKKRSFTIAMSCVHEASALPPITTVHEDDFCEYKVTMESIWGCPLECHSADHSTVCGGHGICAVDTNTKTSRCFCNEGFKGDDCTETTQDGIDEPPPTGGVTSALVVVVCLLLVALLGFSGVLYVKIKKLNADDNPYGAFEDQVPGSAMDMQ